MAGDTAPHSPAYRKRLMHSEAEKLLLQLIKERSFRRGTFRLASGDTSSYYIDGRMTVVHSRGARLIGEIIYERTKDLDVHAIGGLEVGAVPLAAAAVMAYDLHGREMEGFWVRDKVKDHGTQKLVEGNLKPRSRVVIVDDVVTRGSSVIKAAKAVRDLECEVVLVLTLVDRLVGAAELFREHHITDYRPVFTVRDLGVEADAGGTTEAAPR
jgi:orotate phosphoribosyltransferase